MRQRIVLALLGIQTLILAYLTNHFYTLHLGTGSEESFCNVSNFLNCNSVTNSVFSNIMGVPIALLGFFTTLFIAYCFFRGYKLEGGKEWFVYGWMLTLVFFIGDLVLLGVSLFVLKALCLLCLAAYFITFVVLVAAKPPANFCDKGKLGMFERKNFTQIKVFGFMLLSIPLIAAGVNSMWRSTAVPKGYEKFLKASLWDWKNSPVIQLQEKPWITLGPQDASITIVEFADYTCPHCRDASKTFDKFFKTNANIKLLFYAFPLDGTCNTVISKKRGGTTCLMAKAAYCGYKASGNTKLHKALFDKQSKFIGRSLEKSIELAKTLAQDQGLDVEVLMSCVNSPETKELLLKQAAEGERLKIQGTPSIYVEGRYLPGAQNLMILKEALKTLN